MAEKEVRKTPAFPEQVYLTVSHHYPDDKKVYVSGGDRIPVSSMVQRAAVYKLVEVFEVTPVPPQLQKVENVEWVDADDDY